jgi:hypothetical protein
MLGISDISWVVDFPKIHNLYKQPDQDLAIMAAEKIWINPDKTHQFLVVYQDVFHLKSLYVTMYNWLTENGWKSAEPWERSGGGDGNPETMFYDNRNPGNKKLWVWWRLQKATESSFYHYFMNIEFMLLGMSDAEGVNREGTKMKGQLGELTLFIKPWIEVDYGDQWKNNPILKLFYEFYRNRIVLQDLLKREELFLTDTYRFIGTIKKFLEQRTFIPETEILYEPRRKYE